MSANTWTSGDSPGSKVKFGDRSLECLCLAHNRREQKLDASYISVRGTETQVWELGKVTDQLGKLGEETKKIATLQPQTEMLITDNTEPK